MGVSRPEPPLASLPILKRIQVCTRIQGYLPVRPAVERENGPVYPARASGSPYDSPTLIGPVLGATDAPSSTPPFF